MTRRDDAFSAEVLGTGVSVKEKGRVSCLSVASIAEMLDGQVVGNPELMIHGVAPLASASEKQLGFLGLSAFRKQLKQTRAAAVLIAEANRDELPCTGIVVDNPHVSFARIAALFDRPARADIGVHPSAWADPSCRIAETASIGPNCSLAADVEIGDHVVIGPNTVIMDGCRIGDYSVLRGNNTLYQQVSIGQRCIFHAGAVIGSDGFGYAVEPATQDTPQRWVKVPQIGSVRIGNNVEIGANSAVDRGALDDTVLCDGVKIDNLVQIAHNVYLGENTAIAGSSAVAGSAVIGANCKIMGSVLVLGHLELCDGVTISARSLVTRSIRKPGVYSSSISVQDAELWRKNHARLKQLDKLAGRVKTLEKAESAR